MSIKTLCENVLSCLKIFSFNGEITKMFVILTYMIFMTGEVLSIQASLGLYTINNEKLDIPANSVFVGTGGNVPVPQHLWCHGNEEWNICTWIWQENKDNNCNYWEGTSINDCTDPFINIDKEENDCSLKIFSGFTKTDHEGSWECRLSKCKKSQ